MNFLAYFSIIFLIGITFIQRNNAQLVLDKDFFKGFTKEELDVLENAVKQQQTSFSVVSNVHPSVHCEGVECDLCVDYEWSTTPHQICLTAEFVEAPLSIAFALKFDNFTVIKKAHKFDEVCANLPPPLSRVSACLEAYNVTIMQLPNETAICLRTELSLLFPFLSVDFNCFKYETGKGMSLDNSIHYESNAVIDININGGHPIISYHNPLKEHFHIPILGFINMRRKELGIL